MGITGDWDRVITRRTLLRTGGSLAAGMALAGALAPRALGAPPIDGPRPPIAGYPFTLGVASGDPGPHSVVLWTRLAPQPLTPAGGMPAERYPSTSSWRSTTSSAGSSAATSSWAVPDEAHSARAEVQGLDAATEYFYRFKAGREISPVGRTRTAPEPRRDARVAPLRLRLLPELPGRLLQRLRGRGGPGPRRGHPPRRLHLRGAGQRRAGARAAQGDLHARRVPDPPRAVQDRRRPPGRARRAARGS